MPEFIKNTRFISLACVLLVALPLYADEPHPQSHEAIKKMADELEAARKAREARKAEENDSTEKESNDTQAASSGPVTKEEVENLRQQCEVARKKHLAPLRKAAIEECIAKKVKSPSQCEKFYQDFGESGVTQQGNFRQRRFHNIPECQPYYDAEKQLRMNTKQR